MLKKEISLIKLKCVREKSTYYEVKPFVEPKVIHEVINKFLGETDREYFLVICMNARNEINSVEICGVGTLTSCIVSVREVFKWAIASNANSIIVAHTHPTDYVEPSKADIRTTELLLKAAKIIGIPLLDHIIVSGNKYYSFQENDKFDDFGEYDEVFIQ